MTGAELRALLVAKNRTHDDLAAHIGRSTRTISRMVAKDDEPVPRYIEMAAKSLPAVVVVKTLVGGDA